MPTVVAPRTQVTTADSVLAWGSRIARSHPETLDERRGLDAKDALIGEGLADPGRTRVGLRFYARRQDVEDLLYLLDLDVEDSFWHLSRTNQLAVIATQMLKAERASWNDADHHRRRDWHTPWQMHNRQRRVVLIDRWPMDLRFMQDWDRQKTSLGGRYYDNSHLPVLAARKARRQ